MKSLFEHLGQPFLSRLRRRFSESEESELIAYFIKETLAIPAREATALARSCAARRAKLHRLSVSGKSRRALQALGRLRLPLDVEKAAHDFARYSSSTCLLALPLTASSVLLLTRLFQNTGRRCRIINTPLTSRYLRSLRSESEAGDNLFLSSSAMVEHRRRHTEADSSITYVTFPDHQFTRGDTMWKTTFLDEDYQFSTLEPLLFFRGVAPLVTLGVEASGAGARLELVAYASGQPAGEVAEEDVSALLKWLAEQMGGVFRHAPEDVMSWEYVYARSHRMKARTTVMKLKEVEGYIHSWRAADACFDAETYAWALKELRELQGALNVAAQLRRA